MDTDAIVRARRREQALDALEFERGRESALRDQLEEILVELEGRRIDRGAFARMDAEDVGLVREALDPEPTEEWPEPSAESRAEAERLQREEQEAEVERLQQLLSGSRRLQVALERYVAALDD